MERTLDMNGIRELTASEIDAVEGGALVLLAPGTVAGVFMVGMAVGATAVAVGAAIYLAAQ